jgi:hypothetical protein
MLPHIVTVNPMRRKRHRVKNRHRRHSARAKNPHRRHARRARSHRRRVSNPFHLGKGFLPSNREWVAVGLGGAGAIGVDVGLAYLSPYLPAFLQSGWGRIGAQVAVALGMGYVAGKTVDRDVGKAVIAGALTITAYSALRQVLAPTLGGSVKGLSGLADFSDYSPTNWSGGYAVGAGMGAYMRPPNMGAYLTATNAPPRIGMGAYMNPGSFLQKNRMGAYMPNGNYGGYDSESM